MVSSIKSPGSSIMMQDNYRMDVNLRLTITKKESDLERLKRAILESEMIQRSQEVKNSVLDEQIEEKKQEMARVKSDITTLQEYEKSSMANLHDSFKLKTKDFTVEFDEKLSQIKHGLAGKIEASASEFKRKEDDKKLALYTQVGELRGLTNTRFNAKKCKIESLRRANKEEILRIRSEGRAKIALLDERVLAVEELIAESLQRQKYLNITLKRSQIVSAMHVERTMEALKRKCQKKAEDNSGLEAHILKMETQANSFCELYESFSNTATDLRQSTKVMQSEFGILESERRILHNKLQELKGNIRVFCRVKPCANSRIESTNITICNELNESGKQILTLEIPSSYYGGTCSRNGTRVSSHRFELDNIFPQDTTNKEIFLEISQLVQSSLDGFNVCMFAYGQTGSGKTYTMSHSNDGMIPLSVAKIFTDINDLKQKGWQHSVVGHVVEIYNEQIVDLLATGKKEVKHEIKHDDVLRKTSVTNCSSITLQSKEHAQEILERTSRKRSTASTLMNVRSSRSHYAFILNIEGFHEESGARRSGTLNLIDLAGSERLNSSQARGDRLRETQAINKSLSCLGDVVHCLGQKAAYKEGIMAHIPYRNSKLTYLLKHSLGGDSKTLMFVNVSPEIRNVNETINSLRFATKVNGTKLR